MSASLRPLDRDHYDNGVEFINKPLLERRRTAYHGRPEQALAEVYTHVSPNYQYPSFRLLGKEKQRDGRYRKFMRKPLKTPFQRLLEHKPGKGHGETPLWSGAEQAEAGWVVVSRNRLLFG
ncbi:MAG: hypothetical protein LBH70_08855 [Spirochaetaceae bacterium]|jgi:hypothetical protein|nr:hypothetical protein [Spirochaetaceae bacterium]